MLSSTLEASHIADVYCFYSVSCTRSGRSAADSGATDAQPPISKATALSADDLLPLLSFVVVCAYQLPAQPLRHLRALIEYIDALLPAHLKLGQTGQLQFAESLATYRMYTDCVVHQHSKACSLSHMTAYSSM
jgi:hypothetical protein